MNGSIKLLALFLALFYIAKHNVNAAESSTISTNDVPSPPSTMVTTEVPQTNSTSSSTATTTTTSGSTMNTSSKNVAIPCFLAVAYKLIVKIFNFF